MSFHNITLDIRTGNGLDDVLLEPLIYTSKDGVVYRAPVGGTTDGLSVPRCVQNIIPATGGDWFSGVLHDSAYRDQLEKFVDPDWIKASLPKDACDNLLLEAMESQEVNEVERYAIYNAVKFCGGKSFSDDRAKLGQ